MNEKTSEAIMALLRAAIQLMEMEGHSSQQSPSLSVVGIPADTPAPERRNLAQQWAGTLPAANGQQRAQQQFRRVDPSVVDRSANEYQVELNGHPKAMCECGSVIGEGHPVDQNAKQIEGRLPFIACDGTRVYC